MAVFCFSSAHSNKLTPFVTTANASEKPYIHPSPIRIASTSPSKVETRTLMTHNTQQDHLRINQEPNHVFWISGFLKGDDEGDFLKYELTVPPEFEATIVGVLGWKNLDESAYGDCLLTAEQIQQTAKALNVQLPTDLDLFIGLRE
jgi:hypothetical protein